MTVLARGTDHCGPAVFSRSVSARDPLVLRNVRPYGEAQLDVRIENGVIAQLGSTAAGRGGRGR